QRARSLTADVAEPMQAVVTRPSPTGPVWEWTDVPDPAPGPGDVVVRVTAAALNRADALMRADRYVPSDAGWRGGLEGGGVVVAGDVGACAEFVVVDAGLRLPRRAVAPDRAAGLPSGLLTEYDALAQAGFVAGGDVLITGGSSGVGH